VIGDAGVSAGDFLRLPTGVKILVMVLLWPAIWAAVSMIAALAGDIIRYRKRRTSPARRKVACF
jgi:hypothetical protein